MTDMKPWYDYNPPRWAYLLLGFLLALGMTIDVQGRAPRRGEPAPVVIEAKPLGPEPKDPAERLRWFQQLAENATERRVAAMLDAADPDKVQGPITDVLGAKLAEVLGKLIRSALTALLAAALVGMLRPYLPWAAAVVVANYILAGITGWIAGRLGGKR